MMQIRRTLTKILSMVLIGGTIPAFGQDTGYHATADYQGSEIVLFTPWPVFEKTLSGYAGPQKTFRKNIADTVWNLDQYHWTLSGISLDASATFSTTQSPGLIGFQSQASNIHLTIQRIGIHQYVERVVSGILVRAWVDAECGPLDLTQTNAQLAGQVSYEVNPQNISTHLTSFNLQWPPQSWAIAPIHCTGPEGFPILLQQALQENLRTANQIQPMAQQAFADEIQNELDGLVNQIKAPSALPVPQGSLPLRLNFQNFESRAEGFVTHAQVLWDTSKPAPNIRPLNMTSLPAGLPDGQASILLGQTGLQDLVMAEIQNLPAWTHVSLNDQPDFVKLLSSSFSKLFVWPDLIHYNSKSAFLLALSPPSVSASRWLSNGSLQMDVQENAWLQSYRDNRWWNYVQLKGPGQAVTTPRISNGVLTLAAQTTSGKLTDAFGDTYAQAYHPNQYIAASVLQELQTQLNRQLSYQFVLPQFDLGAAGKAKALSWRTLENGFVAIPLQIQ